MKLYTEEQLLNTVKAVLEYDNEVRIEKHLKALQPIELPSNEEIEEESPYIPIDSKIDYLSYQEGFVKGAKWIKEQLENK